MGYYEKKFDKAVNNIRKDIRRSQHSKKDEGSLIGCFGALMGILFVGAVIYAVIFGIRDIAVCIGDGIKTGMPWTMLAFFAGFILFFVWANRKDRKHVALVLFSGIFVLLAACFVIGYIHNDGDVFVSFDEQKSETKKTSKEEKTGKTGSGKQAREEGADGSGTWITSAEPIESGNWVIAELEDFEYVVNDYDPDDVIVLKKYLGEADSLIIPASFEVEGTELFVRFVGDSFAKNEQIVNIVFSEGIREIQKHTLEGCIRLRHLYVPSTIEKTDFLMDFNASDVTGQTLYFGGTQEAWKELYRHDRTRIPFRYLIYGATADDCIKNKDTYTKN